jgi:Homeodomain-like domain
MVLLTIACAIVMFLAEHPVGRRPGRRWRCAARSCWRAPKATNKAVAERLGIWPQTVTKWRGRFVRHRLDGLLYAAGKIDIM